MKQRDLLKICNMFPVFCLIIKYSETVTLLVLQL